MKMKMKNKKNESHNIRKRGYFTTGIVGMELALFSLFSSKGMGLSSGNGDGGLFIIIS